MEKNKKIGSVSFISRDEKPYVRFVVNTGEKSEVFERPVYNEKGEFDPEVSNLLEIARKIDEKSKIEAELQDLESSVVADSHDDSEKSVEENEVDNASSMALVPTSSGTVTVYGQPEEQSTLDKEGFFKKYGRLIAVGLAGVLVGIGITRGCGCVKTNNKQTTNDAKKDNVVTDAEEAKIKYITKDEYLSGASKLNSYFKENYSNNYSANDLYSFYYVANFENISTEVFEELVKEGLIPDNNAGILSNTLKITTIISDKSVRTGVSNVDYNYVFVDEEAVASATSLQQQFNTMKDASEEECAKVVENLENYYVISEENRANNLPVGAEEIIALTEGNSTVIVADSKGVSASDALRSSITDISTLLSAVNHNLNCLVANEAEKQLTK